MPNDDYNPEMTAQVSGARKRVRQISFWTIGVLITGAILLTFSSPNTSDEEPSERTLVHPEPQIRYPIAALMFPSGEWWGKTPDFRVLIRMDVGRGVAAVALQGGDVVLSADVGVKLSSALEIEDRFDLDLTGAEHVSTWTGRLPPCPEMLEVGSEDDIIDTLIIEYVRGTFGASEEPFTLFLLARHPPAQRDDVRTIERLRALIADAED